MKINIVNCYAKVKDMSKTTSITINSRILALRKLLGKNQNDFASELKTTQANISQIENGACVPTGNFFLRIAELYPDTNFNWLISGKGCPLNSLEKQNIIQKQKNKTLVGKLSAAQFNREMTSMLNLEANKKVLLQEKS